MTFRRRVTIVSTSAVALAMALASVVLFLLVRHDLYRTIDNSLTSRTMFARGNFNQRGGTFGLPPVAPGGADGIAQFVDSKGEVIDAPFRSSPPNFFGNGGRPLVIARGSANHQFGPAPRQIYGPPAPYDLRSPAQRLPVTKHTISVAKGTSKSYLSDGHYGGVHYRILTLPLEQNVAVQVARPLDELDDISHDMLRILVIVFVGSIALSLILGSFVMRALTHPVRKLTEATEHVAESRDLTRRIETNGQARDELERLAHSFNAMMEALESATRLQRQLIDDASHELRTPLTSLRTNMDVLLRGHHLDDESRARLVADVSMQLDELSQLVGDLVDLASGAEDERPTLGAVVLDTFVEDATERARRLAPDVEFKVDAASGVHVLANGDRLGRALGNLLTNATKWNPPGQPIEVRVDANGEIVVRDHGPGVSDADKTLIFERFYRADDARDMPGSGLGLAIARKVIEEYNGRIWVTDALGGGASFHIALPLTDRVPGDTEGDLADQIADGAFT